MSIITVILAMTAVVSIGLMAVFVVLLIAIRTGGRHLSPSSASHIRMESAARRLLGLYVRRESSRRQSATATEEVTDAPDTMSHGNRCVWRPSEERHARAASAATGRDGFAARTGGTTLPGYHRRDTRFQTTEEVTTLTVTIPLVVLVAALAWVAWRFMGLRMWQLILCLLLGFLLAATSAAPEINNW